MPYVVRVNQPANPGPKWKYPIGYFPRKCTTLKRAKQLASEAIYKGAQMVRIEYPTGAELDFRPPPRFGQDRPTTPPEPYREVTDEDHKGRELDTQG